MTGRRVLGRARALVEAFLRPVPAENRAHLRELWAALPERLRVPEQMIGRQAEGCGALVGAMPRCDFDCTGCYLGSEANRVPAASLPELVAQLEVLRATVGRHGNVQLTDGEISLRSDEDLEELVVACGRLELIPMLMTHGEGFLRRPERLERLVRAGLREISFHVDTTQVGRRSEAYRGATDEAALDPLRRELAELVRGVRHRTGLPLRAASTVTVNPDNLAGVPGVLRTLLEESDVFRIVSLQPMAAVGRTRARGAVDLDELWDRVAEGLGPSMTERRRDLGRGPDVRVPGELQFGDRRCTRVVMGLASRRLGAAATFEPLRPVDDARCAGAMDGFLRRFGGLSFRADTRAVALARGAGLLLRAPLYFLREGPAFLAHFARRLAPERSALGTAIDVLRRRHALHGFAVVTHHFMNADELDTPAGRERLDACVFRVAVDGEAVPMCQVNAGGLRERVYGELARTGGKAQPAALEGAQAEPSPRPVAATRPTP